MRVRALFSQTWRFLSKPSPPSVAAKAMIPEAHSRPRAELRQTHA